MNYRRRTHTKLYLERKSTNNLFHAESDSRKPYYYNLTTIAVENVSLAVVAVVAIKRKYTQCYNDDDNNDRSEVQKLKILESEAKIRVFNEKKRILTFMFFVFIS